MGKLVFGRTNAPPVEAHFCLEYRDLCQVYQKRALTSSSYCGKEPKAATLKYFKHIAALVEPQVRQGSILLCS